MRATSTAITPRLLLGPGPSPMHPRVLRAMTEAHVGHMDPQFLAALDETRDLLRSILRTANEWTLVIPGTGGAGMETCLVNLLEPGDEALVCVHGLFGARMAEIAGRCGAMVRVVEAPWGEPLDPEAVRGALAGGRPPKLVALVHGETSTGVLHDLAVIGRLARDAGALFVVDAVTTLGGADLRADEWGIDAVYAGSQKCLSGPAGLAPVSFGPRAVEAVRARRTKPASWYLDMTLHARYWGSERAYHHTAPVSGMLGLLEALRMVTEEGLEARFERHRANQALLCRELEAMGFRYVAAPDARLPMLAAVRLPDGVEDAPLRRRLLEEFNIEIAGGLGAFAGRIWRIGLMGNGSSEANVRTLAGALRRILPRAA